MTLLGSLVLVTAAAWAWRGASLVLAQSPPNCTSGFRGAAVGGLCLTDYQGLCSEYVGNSVFLPANQTLQELESRVWLGVEAARKQLGLLGEACIKETERFQCVTDLLACDPAMDQGHEGVPILPCDSTCVEFWTACNAPPLYAFDAFVLLLESPAKIPIPMCITKPPTIRTSGESKLNDIWVGDEWGGRAIDVYPVYVDGLRGVPMLPIGPYTYTLPSGSQVSGVTCRVPPSTSETRSLTRDVKLTCKTPLVLDETSQQCVIPCPYPAMSATDLDLVGLAFVVPGVVGVVLSVWAMLDAMCVVGMALGGPCMETLSKRFGSTTHTGVSSGGGGGDSSPSRPRQLHSPTSLSALQSQSSQALGSTRKRLIRVRASTWYALLGGMLGVAYFAVGPFSTLQVGRAVSCPLDRDSGSPVSTAPFEAIFLGEDYSTSVCKAQRVAPFLLQAVFNLVLHAIVHVWLLVHNQFAKLPLPNQVIEGLFFLYCVGVPCITLGVSVSLDDLDPDPVTSHVQLARQAAMCVPRLPSLAVEFVLVYLPFILTGVLISMLSGSVFLTLRRLERQTHTTGGNRSESRTSMQRLMQRLTMLGVMTFAITIVVMVTTSIATSTLEQYSPSLQKWWICTQTCTCPPCVECDVLRESVVASQPTAGAMGVQTFAMSFVVVVVMGFFAVHGVVTKWVWGKVTGRMVFALSTAQSSSTAKHQRQGGQVDQSSSKDQQLATAPAAYMFYENNSRHEASGGGA